MRYSPLFLSLIAFPALADPPVAVTDICITKQNTPTICSDPLVNDIGHGEPVFLGKEHDMDTGQVRYSVTALPVEVGTIEMTPEGLLLTPAKDFVGRASTTYGIFTMNGGQAEGVIEIAVTCP